MVCDTTDTAWWANGTTISLRARDSWDFDYFSAPVPETGTNIGVGKIVAYASGANIVDPNHDNNYCNVTFLMLVIGGPIISEGGTPTIPPEY
jgi:hypothetical protein